ncbi:uncharacterized protein LOC121713997 [Alosa sapidissima]|uniref:uncharacterized protein LOC121713997 n=1 Tax=Alosa sapidissima TaxID=34773 RepID=UPI001C080D0D|nr:uncharacterized protein LOC121713997 [Alosa sapidissima]
MHVRPELTSSYLSIVNILSSHEGSYTKDVWRRIHGKATYLIVKDQLRSTITEVVQAALPDPVYPGDSETLECVVLAESRTEEEDLRVFWFRPASGGSHPEVIYTNKNWTGPCEGRCVYSLPKKDVNISDAGTYYCGIATNGHILFGNGTALAITEPLNTVLLGLVVALGCCVALMLCFNCKRRITSDNLNLHRNGPNNAATRPWNKIEMCVFVYHTLLE